MRVAALLIMEFGQIVIRVDADPKSSREKKGSGNHMVMRHTSIIIRLLDMKPLVGGFNPSEKYESQWETIITPLLAGWWFQPL